MNLEEIKSAIRARHKLDESTDVRLIMGSIAIKTLQSDDPYKFTARITTDSVDRQNEVVIPAGGDMGEFLNSGAIFWNHNYDQPIGFPNKKSKIERGAKGIAGQDYIECGGIFMKRPNDFQGDFFPDFARAFVNQAYGAGIFPGVSIGFIPTESRSPSKQDKANYGDDIQIVHNKWKLLEFSIAPVQANQDAVVVAVGKGLIAGSAAKALGFTVPDVIPPAPAPVAEEPQVVEETIVIVRRSRPMNIAKMIESQVTRQLLKEFGKIYA